MKKYTYHDADGNINTLTETQFRDLIDAINELVENCLNYANARYEGDILSEERFASHCSAFGIGDIVSQHGDTTLMSIARIIDSDYYECQWMYHDKIMRDVFHESRLERHDFH